MPTSPDDPPISGRVADGFEPVREQFARNFRERNELGAACAVVHRGERVVDLWGGYRDTAGAEPWTEATLALVFSATKGMAAAALALARSRGYFEYDEPVATYWPGFARGGKGDVTVRELLGHRAGLAAVDVPLTPAAVRDRDSLVRTLAGKRPDWKPGRRHGYHAWSLGWYESELLRRTDPERRTLGQFFADEVADPLGLAFHVGLPDGIDDDRVAEVDGFTPVRLLGHVREYPPRMLVAAANPRSVTGRALLPLRAAGSRLDRLLHPFAVRSPARLNEPPYRSVEIPSGNGFGRARDVAEVYGRLACAGSGTDTGDGWGPDADTIAELAAPADPPPEGRRDVVLKVGTAYALGFSKPCPAFRFGSERAFGAPGVGGAFGFADPACDLGFAYTPNRMGGHMFDDPRERALREAVYDCLGT